MSTPKKKYNERVLVVPAPVIFPFDKLDLKTLLDHAIFVDRNDAEEDENFKQIIPYCVLQQGNSYFCYKRTSKGGESRLHERWSLGIGGHLSTEDCQGQYSCKYKNGLYRELKEEVGLDESYLICEPEFLGFIYDNTTPVGRVHLGCAELTKVKENVIISPQDPALAVIGFEPLEYIKKYKDSFENWSQIVIDKYLS